MHHFVHFINFILRIQLTFFCLLFSISAALAQVSFENSFSKFQIIDNSFKEHHVAFSEVKQKQNERIPALVFKILDQEQQLMYQSDLDLIKSHYSPGIFNNAYLLANYLQAIADNYTTRLNAKLSFMHQIAMQDFTEQDSILVKFVHEKAWATNQRELERSWIRKLKFESIVRSDIDDLQKLSRTQANELLNKEFKFSVSAEICKLESDLLNIEATVEEAFFKAFSHSFDPHSDYFSMSNTVEFINQLSSTSYSPGIRYVNSGNQFYISEITPFSFADLNDSIAIGDELTAVLINGEFVAPQCISSESLFDLFYGFEQDMVRIELRSSETKIYKKFELPKQEFASVENHTYCYQLQTQNFNYGYISLPSFYTNFSEGSGSVSGTGHDMAMILLKLKKFKLDGLIVDLRNNGGGSIDEAINISSAFVDYGPLFITKKKADITPELHKDSKRGKLFDGKIIFLVNSASASASEILVNAMKLFPDMLVVGAETFGKATGQTILPLFDKGSQSPFGMVKVSSLRMYDLEGKSYQGKGVQPDIVLPSFPTKKFLGENRLEYSLINKDINKTVKPRFSREMNISKLQGFMDEKLANDSLMQLHIQANLDFEDALLNGFYYSIQLDSIQAFQMRDSLLDIGTQSYFKATLVEDNNAFIALAEQQISDIESDLTLRNTLLLFNYWNTTEDE